jgi:hypothetical protein
MGLADASQSQYPSLQSRRKQSDAEHKTRNGVPESILLASVRLAERGSSPQVHFGTNEIFRNSVASRLYDYSLQSARGTPKVPLLRAIQE